MLRPLEDKVNQEGSGQPGRRLWGSRGWEIGRKGLRSQGGWVLDKVPTCLVATRGARQGVMESDEKAWASGIWLSLESLGSQVCSVNS